MESVKDDHHSLKSTDVGDEKSPQTSIPKDQMDEKKDPKDGNHPTNGTDQGEKQSSQTPTGEDQMEERIDHTDFDHPTKGTDQGEKQSFQTPTGKDQTDEKEDPKDGDRPTKNTDQMDAKEGPKDDNYPTKGTDQGDEQSSQTPPGKRCDSVVRMPSPLEKKRIIFIGPVGSGKSATINTLLGEDKARSENNLQANSLTEDIMPYNSDYGVLVDTPGIMEGHFQSVLKYVQDNPVDAIAFVFAVSRLRSNQKEAIKKINNKLKTYFDKAFILLTNGGNLQNNENEFIGKEKGGELYALYCSVGNRRVVFENCASLEEKRKYICTFTDCLQQMFNHKEGFLLRMKNAFTKLNPFSTGTF